MRKTLTKKNKPVYLGSSILELNKVQKYEFWYAYIKEKYNHKLKLCYINTDGLNIHIKDFYENIGRYVEQKFETSNY